MTTMSFDDFVANCGLSNVSVEKQQELYSKYKVGAETFEARKFRQGPSWRAEAEKIKQEKKNNLK